MWQGRESVRLPTSARKAARTSKFNVLATRFYDEERLRARTYTGQVGRYKCMTVVSLNYAGEGGVGLESRGEKGLAHGSECCRLG